MTRKRIITVLSAIVIGANVAAVPASPPPEEGCPGATSCANSGEHPNQWCETNYPGCNICQFSPFGPFCAKVVIE